VRLAIRGSAEALSLGLTAIAGIWVSRAIGPAHFGYYALVWVLVQVGTMLIGFGTSTAGAQRVANDPSTSGVTWWSIVLGRLGLAAIVVPATAVMFRVLPVDAELQSMIGIALLALVVQPFRSEWLLLGHGHATSLAVLRVVSTAAALIAAVVIVRGPDDAPISTIVISVQSAALAVAGSIAAMRLTAPFVRSAFVAGASGATSMLRAGVDYLRNEVSVFVYTSSDRLFLFVFATPTVLGLYDAAYRIIQPVYAISGVVGDTMYAELARTFRTNSSTAVFRRYVDLMSFATIPFGFFCLTAAPWIMSTIYGDRFMDGADFLRILGWVITLGYAAGIAILPMGAWNRPREYAGGTTWGAAADLVLNAALIPALGGIGAALATVAANLVTVVVGLRNFRRVTDYPLVRSLATYALASAAAGAASLVVAAITSPIWAAIAFAVTYLAVAPPLVRIRWGTR
jgi:O-antigen/teichoic acid export membrane protein